MRRSLKIVGFIAVGLFVVGAVTAPMHGSLMRRSTLVDFVSTVADELETSIGFSLLHLRVIPDWVCAREIPSVGSRRHRRNLGTPH